MTTRLAALATPLLALAWPGAALACAVCYQGNSDESRWAFIAMTGFMTFTPLIVLGLLVRWVRKRADALAELDASVEPEADPSGLHSTR